MTYDVRIDGGSAYTLVRMQGRLVLIVPGGPETPETIYLHLMGQDELAFLKQGEPYLEHLAADVIAHPAMYAGHDLRHEDSHQLG